MNRCKKAREQAGLSIGQAAKLLVMFDTDLLALESGTFLLNETCNDMALVYGCTVEYLRGEGPDMDYEAVSKIPGSRDLCFHDRDILAEFLASQRSGE